MYFYIIHFIRMCEEENSKSEMIEGDYIWSSCGTTGNNMEASHCQNQKTEGLGQ